MDTNERIKQIFFGGREPNTLYQQALYKDLDRFAQEIQGMGLSYTMTYESLSEAKPQPCHRCGAEAMTLWAWQDKENEVKRWTVRCTNEKCFLHGWGATHFWKDTEDGALAEWNKPGDGR